MIERYTLPRMKAIWSEQNKFQKWLEVELLACQAQAQLGNIPEADLKAIREKAGFEVERINQIEAEVHHDVIAFLTNLS
ncbi:MAG: adenylosuccinate lyase, partial [bacterium]|nr:adenylosuccinate lyase [bacterium]